MTDLTEMENSLRWHFDCHAAEPGKGYKSLGIENAVNLAQAALAARDAEWVQAFERLRHFVAWCRNDLVYKAPEEWPTVASRRLAAIQERAGALVREVTGDVSMSLTKGQADLPALADLLDAIDDVEHRESWTVDARYCIACARPWPCPTYTAAERVKAALRGDET